MKMASRKRKIKQPSKSSFPGYSNDHGGAEMLEVKTEPPDDIDAVQIKVEPFDDDDASSNLSLDMLAQVASDRLQSRTTNRPTTYATKKRAHAAKRGGAPSMGLLSLDQVGLLSTKCLINLFSEMESNELTRNFTYTCRLLPETCSQVFTSFGNESKAKARLKDHILTHINQLQREDATFKAEPIQARRKRITLEIGVVRFGRRGRSGIELAPSRAASRSPVRYSPDKKRKEHAFTGLKMIPHPASVVDQHPTLASSLYFAPGGRKQKKAVHFSTHNTAAKKLVRKSLKCAASAPDQSQAEPAEPAEREAEREEGERGEAGGRKPKGVEEKELLITQLLSRMQPYQDHCYTSVFGKQWRPEPVRPPPAAAPADGGGTSARTSAIKYNAADVASREARQMGATSKAVVLKVDLLDTGSASSIHIPIIRLPRAAAAAAAAAGADQTLYASYEEVVVVEGPGGKEVLQGKRNMPLRQKQELMMPYYDELTMDANAVKNERGVLVGEANEDDEDDDEAEVPSDATKLSVSNERKLALQYIRELRCKQGDNRALVCKICKTKTFTATATLLYHYRSHAGIKPFVCLICTETFTRQHSLNYHMLIHNNQSRFTCKDCGRKFRHPSHFKEHMRRHTGETPFACTDCPLRFKTRNTYKRHLKTRHGKLLTASGIRLLPYDEFIKIRTKPSLFLNADDTRQEEGEEEEEEMGEEGEEGEGEEGGNSDEEMEEMEEMGAIPTPASNKLLQFCSQVVSQVS